MDDLTFVALWQVSRSLSEIAAKARISPVSASARASNLRKAGVPLKHFQRGRKPSETTEAIRKLERAMLDAREIIVG